MCKKISTLLVGALIAGGISSAMAVDTGTITFNGRIIQDTCNIDVNGSASSGTVTFSDLSATAFRGNDAIGDSQNFNITLNGCDTSVNKINVKFSGTTVGGTADEVLQTTGTASNLGVRLLDRNVAGAPVNVKFDGSEPPVASDQTTLSTGSATFSYMANVVQVGATAPTSGDYTTQATYELVYR